MDNHNALTDASFGISNMVCEGCAEKMKEVLSLLPGVKSVKPKVFQKQVQVSYNSEKTNHEEIKNAIEKAGFISTEV